MFNGKMKAITFSYDDNVVQDHKLVALLNRYGLKGTFNVNYELFGKMGIGSRTDRPRIPLSEAKALYEGHEIAGHSLTHPNLDQLEDEEVIRQVEEDRLRLSELAGYEVVGFAYPYGGNSERVVKLMKEHTGVRYARTVIASHDFDLQKDHLLTFHPTAHHGDEEMFQIAERFLALKPDNPQLLYIWGHSYEFDNDNGWERMEELCRLLSGHSDIFYGTNKEVLL